MPTFYCARGLNIAILLSTTVSVLSQTPSQPRHVHFAVQAPSSITAPISGRLLIFLKSGTGDKVVDSNQLSPSSTWVGAREVQSLNAGATVEVDPDAEDIASPSPFASIPAGDYEVQAVLDVDHSYNYSGRGSTGLDQLCRLFAALDTGRRFGTRFTTDRTSGGALRTCFPPGTMESSGCRRRSSA